jgi:uncharacterized membrane protein
LIHLSYAIAQFFEIMLGAILRAVSGALAVGVAVLFGAAGIGFLLRRLRRRP